jgi:hypothetical protein
MGIRFLSSSQLSVLGEVKGKGVYHRGHGGNLSQMNLSQTSAVLDLFARWLDRLLLTLLTAESLLLGWRLICWNCWRR